MQAVPFLSPRQRGDGGGYGLTRYAPLILLCAITALAAVLRFAAIDRLPPGLYHDEGFNGLDAVNILRGQLRIFFEANNGREPLFMYLEALGVALFGRTPGALRIASAFVGTLTVPALYWLARELFGRRVALLTALIAATTVWTLNLSRVAFRVVTLPLVTAVALALLWRGLRLKSQAHMGWAGFFLGLSLYTYLAAPFGLLAVALFALVVLAQERKAFWWRGWLLAAGCALITALPILIYHAGHLQSYLLRPGQVSILSTENNGGHPLQALGTSLLRTVLAFFWHGDANSRHNVPLRAIFDPILGGLFLLGLGVALARARRERAYVLALIWLAVLLVPTIMAKEAPHMLRMAGIIPALFAFPALGAQWIWQRLGVNQVNLKPARPPQPRGRTLRIAGSGLLAVALLASLGSNVLAYARHAQSRSAYLGFETAAAEMAADANRFLGAGWTGKGLAAPRTTALPGREVYVATPLWNGYASMRYLCADVPAVHVVDTAAAAPVITTNEALFLLPPDKLDWGLNLLPRNTVLQMWHGAQKQVDGETAPYELYTALASYAPQSAPQNGGLRWSQGVELVGYRIDATSPGEAVVDLYWRTSQPLPATYSVFVHVLRQGALVAQHDGAPVDGLYPTNRWRVGDIVLDRHRIPLTSPFDPRTDQIEIGLYRWENMEHLTLLGADGQPTQQTSAVLK